MIAKYPLAIITIASIDWSDRRWNSLPDEIKYLNARLNIRKPEFQATIEGISAKKAYERLPKDEAIEFASYSSSLHPVFLRLSEEDEELVERTLLPFPLINQLVLKEKMEELSVEEANILRKFLSKRLYRLPLVGSLAKLTPEYRKAKKIMEKCGLTPSEEEMEIKDAVARKLWRGSRAIFLPAYLSSIAYRYISTHSIGAALLPFAFGILPYWGLKIASDKAANRRVRSALGSIATLYFFGRFGLSGIVSSVSYGIGASVFSRLIEKAWPYMPWIARKTLYESGNYLSGLKNEGFDEKEIREKLLEVSFDAFPEEIVETYKRDLEDGLIELEDASSKLLFPAIGYSRRRIVVRGNQIVDESYVKKLAERRGVFVDKIRREIEESPWRYLGIDVKGDEVVFVRDIIGIRSCKIIDGLIAKEAYACLTARKADEIGRGVIEYCGN